MYIFIFLYLYSYYQIKMNQEFGEFLYEWRVKNNHKIVKFWIGPFDVSLDIFNPSYINKQLLKCKFRCRERPVQSYYSTYVFDICRSKGR